MARTKWTPPLAALFDHAVARAGGLNAATPSAVRSAMAPVEMSLAVIKSRLQAHRRDNRPPPPQRDARPDGSGSGSGSAKRDARPGGSDSDTSDDSDDFFIEKAEPPSADKQFDFLVVRFNNHMALAFEHTAHARRCLQNVEALLDDEPRTRRPRPAPTADRKASRPFAEALVAGAIRRGGGSATVADVHRLWWSEEFAERRAACPLKHFEPERRVALTRWVNTAVCDRHGDVSTGKPFLVSQGVYTVNRA
eukprot:jgi/Tetstr1/454198/TSEL_041117.t1